MGVYFVCDVFCKIGNLNFGYVDFDVFGGFFEYSVVDFGCLFYECNFSF